MSDRAIDRVKAILEERGKAYETPEGPGHGAAQLGRAWASILSDYSGVQVPDIPPRIVLLMMVALKTSRAARPNGYQQDNYIDAIAYLDLAEQVITRTKASEPAPSGGGLRPGIRVSVNPG